MEKMDVTSGVARTYVADDADRSPMQTAQLELDAAISTLSDEITASMDRCGNVLGPDRPEPEDGAVLATAAPLRAPHTHELHLSRARVELLIGQMQRFRARLEV